MSNHTTSVHRIVKFEMGDVVRTTAENGTYTTRKIHLLDKEGSAYEINIYLEDEAIEAALNEAVEA